MKRLFYILFCFSLFACGNNQSKAPADLVPRDKMVQILADIHIAEAQVESRVVYPDTALMAFTYQEREVFKKHGVTEQQFRDTYSYYKDNLKEMDALYEIIVDTLSLRETKLRAAGK
ncbi:DUF4296 domain-containing protein [uncultured Pontibacter sp.]|uniref:DUF4296 domain-containing protein n=1 Tax=uncultured Pontibacter sp. TaxID=453356 RepID=UPI00261E7FCF|nr:DUF4296 domain-containing protein [uncultured Pontibacter sp.]